mgnify:FL=1
MISKKIGITLLIFITIMVFGLLQAVEKNNDKAPQNSMAVKSDSINLEKQVATIFKQSCATAGCHRGRYPKKKLNLEEDKFVKALVDVPSVEIESFKLVDTSNPEKSYLLMKIKGEKGIAGKLMPIEAPPLKEEQIQIIETWVFSIAQPEIKEKSSKSKELPQQEKIKTNK